MRNNNKHRPLSFVLGVERKKKKNTNPKSFFFLSFFLTKKLLDLASLPSFFLFLSLSLSFFSFFHFFPS